MTGKSKGVMVAVVVTVHKRLFVTVRKNTNSATTRLSGGCDGCDGLFRYLEFKIYE